MALPRLAPPSSSKDYFMAATPRPKMGSALNTPASLVEKYNTDFKPDLPP